MSALLTIPRHHHLIWELSRRLASPEHDYERR
jgi:hypothetical protein